MNVVKHLRCTLGQIVSRKIPPRGGWRDKSFKVGVMKTLLVYLLGLYLLIWFLTGLIFFHVHVTVGRRPSVLLSLVVLEVKWQLLFALFHFWALHPLCLQVRGRLEDLVTNLQSSKMTLEDQLSREVSGEMICLSAALK